MGTNDTIHPEDLPGVIEPFPERSPLAVLMSSRCAQAMGRCLSLVPRQRFSASR